MQKNEFLRQFFEVLAGSELPHTADQYDYINFDVNFSFDKKENQIAIFTGENALFPVIVEIPKRDHLMQSGLIEVFSIHGKNLRFSKKRTNFIKLIYKYLKEHGLIEVDDLGNIEIV